LSDVAIRLSGLSKAYPIFERPEHRLLQMLARGRRRYYKEFWALRGIDLTVFRGETVGIIGANGSGKSTLLQIICGSLTPTAGELTVNGAISALLELGTGFNPEFTGRENVFINSAILGRSQQQTRLLLPEIEAFADIGEFIDRPVKTYSSGMYARLAFSVAIHVEPDILIVDEILSVGDAPFARKCFARIDKLKQQGGTILFVSHNTGQVLDLCNRALVLHKGSTLFIGKTRQAVSYYQKLGYAPASAVDQALREIQEDIARLREPATGTAAESSVSGPREDRSDEGGQGDIADSAHISAAGSRPDAGGASFGGSASEDGAAAGAESALAATATPAGSNLTEGYDPWLVSLSSVRYPDNGAHIESPRLLSPDGARVNVLTSGQRYRLQYRVRFLEDAGDVRFGTFIKSVTGVELGGARYPGYHEPGLQFHAAESALVELDFDCQLGRGTYFLNCGVSDSIDKSLNRIIDALAFRVEESAPTVSTGTVRFAFSGQLQRFAAAACDDGEPGAASAAGGDVPDTGPADAVTNG